MNRDNDIPWRGFIEQLWLRARRECVPIEGTFELTPLCNFRCRMCYVRLDAEELPKRGRLRTADEWLDLARQAMEAGTYRVTLTGGEVLTRPDFEEIYRKLIEMGLLVTVLSNGSLVDGRITRLFRQHPPVHLRFTLYGSSNETYRRLCGVPDGFDRVMGSLRRLKEAGVEFAIGFTETKENVRDLDAVLGIATALGARVAVSNNLVPAVRGASSDAPALRIPPQDRPAICRCDEDRERSAALEAAARANPELFCGPFARCRQYRTAFWIDWNGAMEPCCFMDACRAKPFEDGFATAWKLMNKRLAQLTVPRRCAACPAKAHCSACPGTRSAFTGEPDGIPETLCREARARAQRAQGASSPSAP